MNAQHRYGWIKGLSVALVLIWPGMGLAQTFSSGSTGADGAFSPSADTTVTLPPNGIFNYTTVTIPAGVTVTYTKNAANTPVTILATGDVTVAGTINVNGGNGATTGTSPSFSPGGSGGPGGFEGGNGGLSTGHPNFPGSVSIGSAGKGPAGGDPATTAGTGGSGASYVLSSAFVSLLPLFGGSGGGGGLGFTGSGFLGSGASGGGGGGAIVIASSTKITVTGSITARGGSATNIGICGQGTGPGSGGAIRLVAPEITGAGSLTATGGDISGCSSNGDVGRIRLEAFTLGFTGTRNPAGQQSTSPGPVTAASNPALINLPTLSISSVGGMAPPSTPGGSYSTADVSLPPATTNPVAVTLTATNAPVGTTFTVKLIPRFNVPTVATSATTGTFATSTATANITFPTGEVSVLNAFGSFTLPLLANLFPEIDGEPVERIMVAAAYGEPSSVSLVTKSGKEEPVAQLPLVEQVRLAAALETAFTQR